MTFADLASFAMILGAIVFVPWLPFLITTMAREMLLLRKGRPPKTREDERTEECPLVGRTGYVTNEIRRRGAVVIDDKTWIADAERRSIIESGAIVEVTDVREQRVTVRRKAEG